MPYYQLKQSQRVPAGLPEVWDFISSPKNLKRITPDSMGFDITTSDMPDKMYPGMVIGYKVSPILKIKMTWLTEITQIEAQQFFIDEQRIGPYKMWHHQHFLEAHDDHTLMKDIVTYQPPFGFLGAIANGLFIRKQLDTIFEYRTKAVNEIFGEYKA